MAKKEKKEGKMGEAEKLETPEAAEMAAAAAEKIKKEASDAEKALSKGSERVVQAGGSPEQVEQAKALGKEAAKEVSEAEEEALAKAHATAAESLFKDANIELDFGEEPAMSPPPKQPPAALAMPPKPKPVEAAVVVPPAVPPAKAEVAPPVPPTPPEKASVAPPKPAPAKTEAAPAVPPPAPLPPKFEAPKKSTEVSRILEAQRIRDDANRLKKVMEAKENLARLEGEKPASTVEMAPVKPIGERSPILRAVMGKVRKTVELYDKAALWYAKGRAEKQSALAEASAEKADGYRADIAAHNKEIAVLREAAEKLKENLRVAKEASMPISQKALKNFGKEITQMERQVADFERKRDSAKRKLGVQENYKNQYEAKADRIVVAASRRIESQVAPHEKEAESLRGLYSEAERQVNEWTKRQGESERGLSEQEAAYRKISFFKFGERGKLRKVLNKIRKELNLSDEKIESYNKILSNLDVPMDKNEEKLKYWRDKQAALDQLSPRRMEAKGREILEGKAKPESHEVEAGEEEPTVESAEKNSATLPKFIFAWNRDVVKNKKERGDFTIFYEKLAKPISEKYTGGKQLSRKDFESVVIAYFKDLESKKPRPRKAPKGWEKEVANYVKSLKLE